jgi:hypothetical protein
MKDVLKGMFLGAFYVALVCSPLVVKPDPACAHIAKVEK